MLVGGPVPSRVVRCRVRGARRITWTLVGLDDTPLEGRELVVASGAERIELHADALPWSPRPYRVDLVLQVDSATEGTATAPPWPLVVLPSADGLFDPAVPVLGPQPGLAEEAG